MSNVPVKAASAEPRVRLVIKAAPAEPDTSEHLDKKWCSRCTEKKSVIEFTKLSSSEDGLDHYCRPCKAIKRKIASEAVKARAAAAPAKTVTITSKECSHCHEIKSVENFGKFGQSRDGLQYACRPCVKEMRREHIQQRKARVAASLATAAPVVSKQCRICKETKVGTEFCKDCTSKDGLASGCKSCINAIQRDDREKNAELRKSRRAAALIRTEAEWQVIWRKAFGDKLETAVRKCWDCKEEKLLGCFSRDYNETTGIGRHCKDCESTDKKSRKIRLRERSDEEIKRDQARLLPDQKKRCGHCKETLPLDQFYSHRTTPTGLYRDCATCLKEHVARWRVKLAAVKTEAKKGKCCEVCKRKDPLILEFAHLDRSTKLRDKRGVTVGPGEIKAISTLIAELPKTRILCAVCHALETSRENEAKASTNTNAVHKRAVRAKFKAETCQKEKLRRGKCVDCKRKVTPELFCAFEFDHLPEYEKITEVGKMTNSLGQYTHEEVETEMRKCDLRCRNCHRIKTVERRMALKTAKAEAVGSNQTIIADDVQGDLWSEVDDVGYSESGNEDCSDVGEDEDCSDVGEDEDCSDVGEDEDCSDVGEDEEGTEAASGSDSEETI